MRQDRYRCSKGVERVGRPGYCVRHQREYMLEEAIRQLKAIPVDVVAGVPGDYPGNTDFLVISPGVPMNISCVESKRVRDPSME